MGHDLRARIDALENTIARLRASSKRSLGFVQTIEYMGITFDVSRRFVIADLSPLAFFHLVEHIDKEGAASAVARLHERLLPLLTCEHQWTPLRRLSDEPVQRMACNLTAKGRGPHICRSCTAYALGGSLPVLGRLFAAATGPAPHATRNQT